LFVVCLLKQNLNCNPNFESESFTTNMLEKLVLHVTFGQHKKMEQNEKMEQIISNFIMDCSQQLQWQLGFWTRVRFPVRPYSLTGHFELNTQEIPGSIPGHGEFPRIEALEALQALPARAYSPSTLSNFQTVKISKIQTFKLSNLHRYTIAI